MKGKYNKNKHEHLERLNCPRCGRRMKKIAHRYWLVGCAEYEIFWCHQSLRDNLFLIRGEKRKDCQTLVINYPHDSAGKKNKIIQILKPYE